MAPVDSLASGVVTGPSGESFAWRVELAPKPNLWVNGPRRLWSALTGDRSWWLTAWRSRRPGPGVRSRHTSRDAALDAAADFEDEVRRAAFRPPAIPPLMRRSQ